MLESLNSLVTNALGLQLESHDIDAAQMSLRAFVVFVISVGMIRLGNKRFMGKSTAMDVMLGIVFGSLMGRAITGNSPFMPTLAAGLTLVATHWAFSAIAVRWHGFGILLKGHDRLLIENGQLKRDAMRKSHITESDLCEALRGNGTAPDFSAVAAAHLERNGNISIIKRKKEAE
ncbi:MAG TPA: YetF domain-containing protein [Chthoniobacteraceae bacterium]|jgi:uncharacterized membrane protein YcaP (DUF421 family)